jgi:hypothetical protein
MGKPQGCYTKQNKPVMKGQLCDSTALEQLVKMI